MVINIFKYLSLNLFCNFLVACIFYFINSNLSSEFVIDTKNKTFENINSNIIYFLLVALIMPIIETFILIYLPYKFFKRVDFPKGFAIFHIGLLFAIMHTHSAYYVCVTFFSGIIYALAIYQIPKYKFWSVTLIHCLKNIIALSLTSI